MSLTKWSFFKLFYEFQSSEVISVCCLLSLDLQPIERLQRILNCGLLLDRIGLEPSTNRKASTWLYENYELSDLRNRYFKKKKKTGEIFPPQSYWQTVLHSSDSRPHLLYHLPYHIPVQKNKQMMWDMTVETEEVEYKDFFEFKFMNERTSSWLRLRAGKKRRWRTDSYRIAVSFTSTDSQGLRSSLNSRSSTNKPRSHFKT